MADVSVKSHPINVVDAKIWINLGFHYKLVPDVQVTVSLLTHINEMHLLVWAMRQMEIVATVVDDTSEGWNIELPFHVLLFEVLLD